MQVALVHMLVHVRHATLYKLLFPLMQKSCNLAAGSILEKNQIDDRASRFSL
ncbi:MAG: hypothetical protein P8R48_09390 [Planctomycetota bacterium]|nr:hypothetical protein [Planctomycetota bacterium]